MTLRQRQKLELNKTLERIVYAASRVSGASVDDCSRACRRKARDVRGRALAVAATQQIVGMSYQTLAERFGYGDHTSCLHLVRIALRRWPDDLRRVVNMVNDPRLMMDAA